MDIYRKKHNEDIKWDKYDKLIIDLEKYFLCTKTEIKEFLYNYIKEAQKKRIKNPDDIIKFICKSLNIENTINNKVNNNTKKYSLANIPKILMNYNNKESINNIKKITVSNLVKSYGTNILFKNISFEININDKIALVGANGSGKSSLLKILYGIEEYDDGLITKDKSLKIGYISQELIDKETSNITVHDFIKSSLPEINKIIEEKNKIEKEMENGDASNLDYYSEILEKISQLNAYTMYEMQTEILKYFGFNEEQINIKVNNLSGGEKTKLILASIILQQPDILLLDEPTNHLDILGIVWLEEFLRKWNKGIICVSHDKTFINSLFTKIFELSNKNLNIYYGNYDDYIIQKTQKLENNIKEYNTQQKYFKKQEEFINKNRARTSKAKQVQSRIKMLEKIEKINKPQFDKKIKPIKLNISERIPLNILEITKLTIGYNTPLIHINNIDIKRGDKIGIIGRNGVGKSTFLKTILNIIPPIDGDVYINPQIKIGYYSQTTDELNYEATILEELCNNYTISQQEVRNIMGNLLITGDKVNQKIKVLSGGEKAKVALTKLILQKPHILIMDEPTNHLDIQSKEAIIKMLYDFDGVILLVSHDRYILTNTTNKIWLIKNMEITQLYNDNLNNSLLDLI